MVHGVEERLEVATAATGGAEIDGAQRSPQGEASGGGGRINRRRSADLPSSLLPLSRRLDEPIGSDESRSC